MYKNEMMAESKKLKSLISEYWGEEASEIEVEIPDNTPFGIFFLEMKLYGKFKVKMEYERSTLGISVKNENSNDYVILSKMTDQKIYRGLQSYKESNLKHNFEVLNNLLKDK
ncbi:hypothetical protein [Listeria sp. ILCC792]|uniref:hypothetical protein n=1 Tax=Listeria sp. ILCC792 TaxID=1918331 RepID=UPI000B58CF30|nr:hypothetical protein [Listeria sp. ILCC792]